MLTRTPGWKTTSGKHFTELKDGQTEELSTLLNCYPENTDINQFMTETKTRLIEAIMQNSERVVDILTTTESSRGNARRVNGGRKPRKSKATPTPEPTPA